MRYSGIQWTHHTHNEWWICEQIGPGCANCFAIPIARRHGLAWGPDAPRLLNSPTELAKPLAYQRYVEATGEIQRVFCGSMMDVLDNHLDCYVYREALFQERVKRTYLVSWQFCTKRIGNAEDMLTFAAPGYPVGYSHVGWIATVCNQMELERDIRKLMRVPALWHALGYEPGLGPLDLRPALEQGIDWVIIGGESGRKARRFDLEWAMACIEQCAKYGVACFMKQVGANAYLNGEPFRPKGQDSHGGNPEFWPEPLRVRQFPEGLMHPPKLILPSRRKLIVPAG